MGKINLNGFDIVQKDYWEQIRKRIEEEGACKVCGGALNMTSKWRAVCAECGQKHTIHKPKNFPKNMNDMRNWKSTCEECGGKMDFYKGGACGAYICRKCGNVLEV